jgi:hypothetical protein
MMQGPPPLWPQQPPPGAPPGARPPPSLAKRMETLGNVCLVLSLVELLYCAQKLLAPLFTRNIFDMEKVMFRRLPGAPPISPMMDAAAGFVARIAIWETTRTVPFVVATCFLLWIAIRLRRGDAGALVAARTWMPFALAAVFVSALIQVLFTLPMTMEYQRQVVELMPAMPSSAAAPFDVKAMTSMVTMLSAISGLVMGTLFLSVWPVMLYVWAGRLSRDAAKAEVATPALPPP